jgi:hypothetical protein
MDDNVGDVTYDLARKEVMDSEVMIQMGREHKNLPKTQMDKVAPNVELQAIHVWYGMLK